MGLMVAGIAHERVGNAGNAGVDPTRPKPPPPPLPLTIGTMPATPAALQPAAALPWTTAGPPVLAAPPPPAAPPPAHDPAPPGLAAAPLELPHGIDLVGNFYSCLLHTDGPLLSCLQCQWVIVIGVGMCHSYFCVWLCTIMFNLCCLQGETQQLLMFLKSGCGPMHLEVQCTYANVVVII